MWCLQSARLRLRPFEDGDVDALHAQWNEPEVRLYLFDDEPVARDFVRGQVEVSRENFAVRGCGFFAVFPHEDPDGMIGFTGLRAFGRPERIELLYALRASAWGRGYATEASAAVLGFAFSRAGLGEVWAGADPPNAASFRVMERLGMTFREDLLIEGRPARCYRITRDEFERRYGA